MKPNFQKVLEIELIRVEKIIKSLKTEETLLLFVNTELGDSEKEVRLREIAAQSEEQFAKRKALKQAIEAYRKHMW